MTPYKLFDLQVGDAHLFGPEFGSLALMTKLAGNVALSRRRRFQVEAAPGGTLVTRLTDKEPKPPKPASIRQQLLDIGPGRSRFYPASESNHVSIRTTATVINRTGERRLTTHIVPGPTPGTLVTSLDIAAGITDATGAPIDFTAGQRMRKYPFVTMKPGDSFTVPAGATDIVALRGSVQHYRTRNPALQYKITRNKDGGFTVTCAYRAGSAPVPAVVPATVPLKTNETRDFEEW